MWRRDTTYEDAVLGGFERHRGAWRGRLQLPHLDLPLTLPGGRGGPEPDAVTVAQSMVGGFHAWLPQIASAFRLEYELGNEADDIAQQPTYAAVIVLDRQLTVEFGYCLPGDDDHTVGARLRDGRLVELNGSVLEP